MKKCLQSMFVFIALLATPVYSAAQGPPCWDKVPPSEKYAHHHVITGTGQTLQVDGLVVSVGLADGDSFLRVEVSVTNCSAEPVKINPQEISLFKMMPDGDVKLASLDPTHYVRFPRTGKTYAPLVTETLPYGRIGSYQLFFERDGHAQTIDMGRSNYRLGLTVLVEKWQFDFQFPRKKL
jgi:hypothetical protein